MNIAVESFEHVVKVAFNEYKKLKTLRAQKKLMKSLTDVQLFIEYVKSLPK